MEDESVLSSPNPKKEEEEIEEREKEENILIFLDSLDRYLSLVDSLTSTLRKGWLDLASARHSMGASRISSSLFDLKVQSAATTVQVSESIKESQSEELHYTLSKWGSLRDNREDVGELQKCNTSQLRHRGSSQLPEDSNDTHTANGNSTSSISVDNSIQKERSKSLAVFGGLVSPKLSTRNYSRNSEPAVLDVVYFLSATKGKGRSA